MLDYEINLLQICTHAQKNVNSNSYGNCQLCTFNNELIGQYASISGATHGYKPEQCVVCALLSLRRRVHNSFAARNPRPQPSRRETRPLRPRNSRPEYSAYHQRRSAYHPTPGPTIFQTDCRKTCSDISLIIYIMCAFFTSTDVRSIFIK